MRACCDCVCVCVCVCVARADGSMPEADYLRSAVPMNRSQQMGPLLVETSVKKRNTASSLWCNAEYCDVVWDVQCNEGVKSCLTVTYIQGLYTCT